MNMLKGLSRNIKFGNTVFFESYSVGQFYWREKGPFIPKNFHNHLKVFYARPKSHFRFSKVHPFLNCIQGNAKILRKPFGSDKNN